MSKALAERIIRKIGDSHDGWIPFEEYMREALYAPELGYYESGEVFGASGDYITGVDVGPWLALGMADLIEWGWQQLGSPKQWTLIEQGGGEGRLLCAVLRILGKRDIVMPARIHAVERSAHMGLRQQAAYAELGGDVQGVDVQLYTQLDELPVSEHALFFCNELPDAFPVRCFSWRDGRMHERGVGLAAAGEFAWRDNPSDDTQGLPQIDEGIVSAWPEGYISEWNPHLADWQAAVSRSMQRGFVFCVDYGYAQSEYYRPNRIEGTLLAHLKHEPVTDILADPGSRDITAHIDFTALGRAGEDAGLDMGCWMTQGAWLAQSPGVQAYIQQAVTQSSAESAAVMASAKRMLMPQGMGEMFKLSVQAKGLDAGAPDFLTSFNRVAALGLGRWM